ncbi:MAG: site-specific integrase [Chlamydiia bacterium]|nr:site-specific integrase [Chlamydiia bacterium]
MGSIRELKKKDGSRSYHAEVRVKGAAPQRATFRNKSLAKKWIQDTESAIRDGRHFRTNEARRRTLGELIERLITKWLPHYPRREKNQAALLTWWSRRYGHLLLSDFSPVVIAEARDWLLSTPTHRGQQRSASTVNRYLSAIGKALSIAEKEWQWIDRNPTRQVTRCSEGPSRERFRSPSEKQRLLAECKASRNANLLPMVRLSLITGMRLGEVQGLRWRDIDLIQGTITLWQTKNGDNRILPLTAEASEVLQSSPDRSSSPESLVFHTKGKLGEERPAVVRYAFERALGRAAIHDFRWHDLRHTAASYMAMSGATQGELMAILGHRSPAMTRRYAHYSQQHLGKVMERAGNTHS